MHIERGGVAVWCSKRTKSQFFLEQFITIGDIKTLCYAQLNTKCYIPHNIYKGMLIIL